MDLSNITVNAQSSIRIAGEKIVYFDPFNVAVEKHDADIIFVTHEHFDHFQPESIAKIKKEDTIIVAPLSMQKQVEAESGVNNTKFCQPGESLEIMGVKIETVPAYNILKPFHMKSKKWQGYLVCLDGIKYYVAGDTDANEDIKKVKCDVALVPVGGKFTMDKKQAAEYIAEIKPQAVIPTHYGAVVGNDTDGSEFIKILKGLDEGIQAELRL